MKHNWIKILYCFMLTAFLMVSLVPEIVYAAPDTEEIEVEEVVFPEDAIYLSTAEELFALAENCIDDDWSVGKTVVLQNDIDLTDVDFYGIPTFGGTFYGEGHSIKGWSVEHEGSVVGFFRYTQSKAVINDLHIEGTIHPVGSAKMVGTIAGYNGGTIKNCSFTGTVSGKEIIGGIVGSQNGYVVDCTNYGNIEGSDGVGGIAGQFMPNIVLEFGPDPIETMQNKMNSMMNSMKDSMNEMKNSMSELEFGLSDGSLDMSAEMDEIKEALESLEDWKNPETGEIDPDRIDSLLNDFSNSFEKIYEESTEITNITDSLDISSKMDEMMSEMEGMMNSMGSMEISTEINIQDVSRYDREKDTIGKISGCINYGEVAGENGIAGIAGNCDSEMIMSEEDIQTKGEESMNINGSIRLILRDCKNFGTISANKDYVGGIAGQMVQGAILDCYNVGHMDALNADYVGGIAGNCDTYISGCISKNIIAGADYVGGIAGCGVEVNHCYALVDIVAGTEYVGSIIGGMEVLPDADGTLVSENYYCYAGTDCGGIDGINYKGATARMTLEDFLALEDLAGMFKTVNIRFVAEGQEDVVMAVGLGENLALEEVPVLEAEEHEMYSWVYVKPVTSETLGMNETEEVLYLSEERLTGILFDQIYEAEFEAKHMVSQGEEKTEDNHSIILAVGAFDKNTTVTLTDMLAKESVIDKVTLKENWEVTISNIGVKKLHYRIPTDMQADKIQLFVKDASGSWTECEYIVEGSYLVFDFAESETGFALAETSGNSFYLGMVAVVIVIVVIILVIVSKKRKQRVVKKGNKE